MFVTGMNVKKIVNDLLKRKRRQTDTIWLNVPSKYTAIALFLFIENPFNNI